MYTFQSRNASRRAQLEYLALSYVGYALKYVHPSQVMKSLLLHKRTDGGRRSNSGDRRRESWRSFGNRLVASWD